MVERICANCRYWERGSDREAEMGECRIQPPVGMNCWPDTKRDDWCAQFTAQPTPMERAAEVWQGAIDGADCAHEFTLMTNPPKCHKCGATSSADPLVDEMNAEIEQ